MIDAIASILLGLVLGVFYGGMFVRQFLCSEDGGRSDLKRVFNSFLRLVFITVAIIISVIYIKLNFMWLLLFFLIAFWGAVLSKVKAAR